MKTFIRIAFALAATLAAPAALASFNVFTCEPEWAALAKEIGGKDVDVYSASTALQDVHKIQPRPSLIAKYHQADLVICTGAELEIGWLPPLAEKGNNGKVLPGSPGSFDASQFVTMLEVPSRLDRSEGDIHPYGNPHIQTGPQNIEPVAKALADRLAELDGKHAEAYRSRYEDFSKRWAAAMEKWAVKVKPLKGVNIVAFHRSWAYLYDFTGLKEVAELEPKPGIPPSGAHLEEVLATLKARPAKMVIYSAYEDSRPAEWLADNAHIPAVQLPFSVGGVPGADDLFKYFDATFDRLLQALSGAKAG
jgi:zinc/manganese transport system substrate-binding protein